MAGEIEAHLAEYPDDADGPRDTAAENRRLREALRPFADYAAWALEYDIPPGVAADDTTPVWGRGDGTGPEIQIGDLKRARAALSDTDSGGTG